MVAPAKRARAPSLKIHAGEQGDSRGRAGIDALAEFCERRLDAGWLILDEFNEDAIGRSFYLEPDPPLGRFSRAFFLPLMRQFVNRRAKLRSVRRHD
jgi:hypothetical protein